MYLVRRTFIGGAVAAVTCARAAALQKPSSGLVLDFEEEGGSVSNSGDRNRRVYVNAIAQLTRSGGGTLTIPPKVYPFDGIADATGVNVTVLGPGATFQGEHCRIVIESGSDGYNLHGLKIVETSGSASTFLLNCVGSNCHFKDVHLEKNPPTGGYIGYCQQGTSGNLYENISFSGSNGMFLGGRNHEVRGGWAEAAGGDDCWALKATVSSCENIRISGFRARGFAAVVSIGSEVGSQGVDDPTRRLAVRNVTVDNCEAENCTYFAYVKPGAVEAYDYRDGLVEDVTISNCRCDDPAGTNFRNAIYVSPARGSLVRRMNIKNLSVTARGGSPAVQNIGALYFRPMALTNGAGDGGSIEDVFVDGLRCIDPYQGVPSSSAAPGLPIHIPIALEKHDERFGRIGRVQISNVFADGCARSAVLVGAGLDGPISLTNCEFRNFAAGILASMDMNAIIQLSPAILQNVVATPSPLAPEGTKGYPEEA